MNKHEYLHFLVTTWMEILHFLHTGMFSKFYLIEPKSGCIYHFPTDLESNGRPFGSMNDQYYQENYEVATKAPATKAPDDKSPMLQKLHTTKSLGYKSPSHSYFSLNHKIKAEKILT